MTPFHNDFKLRLLLKHSFLGNVVLFFALPGIAAAQGQLQIDFGVRGGTFNSGIPIEVSSNHYFPPRYSTDKIAPTFGPTVGVLINNRFGVRLEAVRSRFRWFHAESGTPFPASSEKFTATTDGHIWQYPLLVTVHSSEGPLRAFGGGGISLGRSIRGTTTRVTTRVSPLPGGVTTVTTTTEPCGCGSRPFAFYITGGLDGRVSLLSIRPELRFGHSHASLSDWENQMIFSSNQLEFLVGITVHPFRFKLRQKQ